MLNLKSASLTGYFILAIVVVGLFVENSILASGYIASIVQIMAVLLMIWARITFGRRSFHAAANPTEGGLVTTGPYAYIRHPIYASILYFLWAAILSHLSFTNSILGVIGTIGVCIRIYAEEHLIICQYPEYIDYAARTKRVIPFLI
jgi:protein-S-isoprenylcysteine O-methyltransferase Ste14